LEFGTVKYGHLRKWLHFDGVDDYAQIQNSPSLNPSSITVIALIKNLDYSKNILRLFRKENAYELEYRPLKRYIHFNRWINGTKLYNYTARGTLPDSGVIFLACVYDETWTKAKIYCQGQSLTVQGDEQSGALDSSDDPILIAKPSWENYWMNANVYFIALYNRALSDAEISQMYDYVMNGKGEMITDGLQLWLDGDSIDIANGIWRDKSGNGNDGTIYGAIYNSNWGEVKYGAIHYGA